MWDLPHWSEYSSKNSIIEYGWSCSTFKSCLSGESLWVVPIQESIKTFPLSTRTERNWTMLEPVLDVTQETFSLFYHKAWNIMFPIKSVTLIFMLYVSSQARYGHIVPCTIKFPTKFVTLIFMFYVSSQARFGQHFSMHNHVLPNYQL